MLYGTAEFSRDADFPIVADPAKLARLKKALADLQAEVIAILVLDLKHLRRGHAVHFRRRHPEAAGMRVDIMSRMCGVSGFPQLWKRRTTIELPDGLRCELLGFEDLVQAKKRNATKIGR